MAALLLAGCTASLVGCTVRVYQPMSGLHRPVVVDPQAPNLSGLRLAVYCLPGGLLSPGEAALLCQRVGLLFENQGAIVETATSSSLSFPGEEGEDSPAEAADLILELRARLIHKARDPMMAVASGLTFTLAPVISETTFAQDVVIRDGSGFLLASESLQGRTVERFGAGPWLSTWLVNLGREEAEKITEESFRRDLSADLYRQLSQLMFNAKMQREVLLQAAPPTSASPEAPSWR